MEYYSAIRNDKYPPFASTWMELEYIMLSEISQSEKDKHYMFFIHSSFDGHWGSFHSLAIVDIAAINIGVQVSQRFIASVSLG